jgi:arginyl-tRNA synthetase
MATLDRAGLTQLLKDLSIAAPTSDVAEATILSNPLDLCRTTLAELLAGLVDCDVQTAYKSIQWPNNIFNGDLSVTVPKLCPGRKPVELSSQLVDKVGPEASISESYATDSSDSSQKIMRSSIRHSLMACICACF